MSKQPLRGLRVLDLSKVLAGPLCAQYLGDMGADVIKIESPRGGGDETRGWPPLREGGGARTGAIFISTNRNKRSIAVDLATDDGREIVHRLARRADVAITSFGPGVATKLGVDSASLRALNPRLVFCDISGFGSVGPMSQGKGYDVILQAFCGMLSITGEADGPPVRSPFSPVDQGTGLHALAGILAALYERERSGVGGTVEASLFDTATGFLAYFLQNFWERGTEPVRPGSGHESLCPYQVFETADKPLILGVANDALWQRFCALAGLESVRDDPRFATNATRVEHRAQTLSLVSAAMRTRGRADWLQTLDAAGIPCSPLHTLGELSAHPHTRASGMVFEYEHPALGTLATVAQPLRFDGERTEVRRAAPMHGEHTREVLAELGYSEAEIVRLASKGEAR
ncbi:CaiB/BaiF CoA transferase family protein [Variovorax sp. PBL-E5]|uniref:CaiB/BaiF CoA transferase family protein n=1 Tax=Variovorax sp. PBL-E5 TaxID=434014 RepID=UPI00131729D0|nr:CaiB/BaiF CoA-transferase family protein [Variovorax sp. PBL-E5]VTU32067.1 Formyl-coenzyme A transferase [Variovorax sp. PBL-E5]